LDATCCADGFIRAESLDFGVVLLAKAAISMLSSPRIRFDDARFSAHWGDR
jgi:hypothetical protein